MVHSISFVLICGLLVACKAFEPFTTVIGAASVTVLLVGSVSKPLYCRFAECCTDPTQELGVLNSKISKRWINRNISETLLAELTEKVYGQHLVTKTVVSSLAGHLLATTPQKALVLSFHGWTGSGKNHVSKIIAGQIYRQGMRSQYVHFFSATRDFSRLELVDTYKDQIRDWVRGNISECPYQLFIFDEVEKMPIGLLDVLKPFADFYEPGNDGIDYRKAIFIILGNVGGNAIKTVTYDHWLSGKPRETLELKDVEKLILSDAYNEEGGLKRSFLIGSDVISHYIPFLPMEHSHVRLCIISDLEAKNYTAKKEIVDKVLSQLSFTPDDIQLYSKTGCKRVSQKVDFIMGGGL